MREAIDNRIGVQVAPTGQTVPIPATEATETAALAPAAGGGRRALDRLRPVLRNQKAAVGAVVLVGFVAVALLAPVIAPGDPNDIVARRHLPPSAAHWFGTTGAGQDVFAQTVWGTRLTLSVGLAVGILTTLVAIAIGMIAGYFRGRIDDALSLLMNVFLIIPSLPLLVVLAAFLGSGNPAYFVFVLTVTGWAWPARVLRSQTLSLREKDFVSAAEVSGDGWFRIIFREILPNMTSIAVAGLFGSTIYAIGAVSALEFLGLGNPSVVSWGTNLYWAGNNGALLTGAWWTVLPSGLCIALIAFAFALVNFAVDEVTNPRLRVQRLAAQVMARAGGRLARSSRATPVVRHAG
jgi:peptide/nickel transport system permease protein